MNWIDEFVDDLFDTKELTDVALFAEEHGLTVDEVNSVDEGLLYNSMMRRFKREATLAIPKLAEALLEKAYRGDIAAIRLVIALAKPETVKGKGDDPMESFRES